MTLSLRLRVNHHHLQQDKQAATLEIPEDLPDAILELGHFGGVLNWPAAESPPQHAVYHLQVQTTERDPENVDLRLFFVQKTFQICHQDVPTLPE